MSQALPMTQDRRWDIYAYNGRRVTARQWRQFERMADRQELRAQGVAHGATGERIRRPLVHVSLPPERGSIRTHIAAYCAPCDRHGGLRAPWDPSARPRLHRYAIGSHS